MPKIVFANQSVSADIGENLLDVLNRAGANVPFSCRAGSCQICLVRKTCGDITDAAPLNADQQQQGWCLACQCQVAGDAEFEVYDPSKEALPATVETIEWLSASVARLRLTPARAFRYAPGQSTVLWLNGVARAYSIANAHHSSWLEFHISCAHQGAFANELRNVKAGDALAISAPRSGGLFYDSAWQASPLYLMAQGTGLAPLWGILQQALGSGHTGPIELWHFAEEGEHYLRAELDRALIEHPNLYLRYLSSATIEHDLASIKLASRQAHALLCGNNASVELMAKRLYLAGLPRSHLHTERFLLAEQ